MGDTKFRQTGYRTAKGPYRSDEKARKRTEGEARNAAYAALSPGHKMTLAIGSRGESKKQRAKLAKLLEV